MTYLLVMILVVGGLFATDGGDNMEGLNPLNSVSPQIHSPNGKVQTSVAKLSKVIIDNDPAKQLGLYRFFLANKQECVVSRNQQAISCSAGAVQTDQDHSLRFHQFKQLPYPAPGLHRLVFNDGLDCVLTASKTGLSCHWGAPLGKKPASFSSTQFMSARSGPGIYLISYQDKVSCVLPKTKSSLWCRWPAAQPKE